MAARFEKVSRFADVDLPMPIRATSGAAGYDFVVAEDTVIPTYRSQFSKMESSANFSAIPTLDEVAKAVKQAKAKVTLVSTGMKCYLDEGTYLELSVRSSTPLKNWLILANGVGIIDRDYCDSPESEGEIYLQLINLSPWPILLKRGDRIGQGIIKPYLVTEDDNCSGLERTGGFGSSEMWADVPILSDSETVGKALKTILEEERVMKNLSVEELAAEVGMSEAEYRAFMSNAFAEYRELSKMETGFA